MQQKIAAVQTDDLCKILGTRTFIALPREEIERMHASIEVMPDDGQASNNSLTPLTIFTITHFNYNWIIYKTNLLHDKDEKNTISLGIGSSVRMSDFNGLFLDNSLDQSALRIAEQHVSSESIYNIRLAGLLNTASFSGKEKHLVHIYIVRLRQPAAEALNPGVSQIQVYGTGELQQQHDRFDSISKILIDNINAF